MTTGWALLVGAAGMLYDGWSGWALGTDGSIGLIPAYLGMVVGLLGLSFVIWRVAGGAPGLLAMLGTAGILVFWGSYPSYATAGGLGGLLIGWAVLFLPSWARFTSPLWVSSGILGITELVRSGVNWGPVSGWTLWQVHSGPPEPLLSGDFPITRRSGNKELHNHHDAGP